MITKEASPTKRDVAEIGTSADDDKVRQLIRLLHLHMFFYHAPKYFAENSAHATFVLLVRTRVPNQRSLCP